MRVRLLGGLSVDGVDERDLGSRKARTLLKMLALRAGTAVTIDELVDRLWDDEPPARPAEQVGVLVSRLRGVVGTDRIVRSDAGYTLIADWVDVDELAALAAAAGVALAEGRVGAARAAAGAAMATARGPLLPDEEGPWIEVERAAVAAHLTVARRVAIEAAVAAGDVAGAAGVAEQVLATDPYDEVVLRALMQAHLTARRPASALAAYARVRERLAEDLGVPPTAETEALHAVALAAADGDMAAVPELSPLPESDGRSARSIVGRDAELAALDSALAEAAGGAAVMVLVEGDAGMGKTVLLDTWLARLPTDVLVVRGRCDELGRDLPLQPVVDALSDRLSVLGPTEAVTVLGPDAAILAPLLGPAAETTATAVADADERRAHVFTALVNTLARAAGERTAVIVVEDLHFAATATAAWLAFAHRRATRTVLVATTRGRSVAALTPTTRLVLRPLTVDEVETLVGRERAVALYERSGGHPLLLSAFVDAPEGSVPATVRDAVNTQLATLPDRAAGTLRVAATLGLDCDIDVIAGITEISAVETLSDLEAALSTGLVIEQGTRFAFRHELLRDAIDATIGAAGVRAPAGGARAGGPSGRRCAGGRRARQGGRRSRARGLVIRRRRRASRRSV